jgi:hypothetical protein
VKSLGREAERVETQIRAQLIDELMDRYIDWREQCIAVENAYEGWSTGPADDRPLAFEAYRAALDLEEHASFVYADRIARFEREFASRVRHADRTPPRDLTHVR